MKPFSSKSFSSWLSITLYVAGTGWLLWSPAAYAECDPSDLEASENDCDEDGVTVGEGDCDDDSEVVSPDLDETCSDGIDNNCDDQIDEGCESFPDGVVLSGGGQCGLTVAASGISVGLVSLLVVARREQTWF